MTPIPLPPFPFKRRQGYRRIAGVVPGDLIDPLGGDEAIMRVWLTGYSSRKPAPELENLCRAALKLPEMVRLLEEMESAPARCSYKGQITEILDSIRQPAPIEP